MNRAPNSRRGSFLETWRLFASGGATTKLSVLIGFAAICVPAVTSTRPFPFGVLAVMVLVMFAAGACIVEASLTERLAFMSMAPQSVDAKWLVLAPMCVLAIAFTGGLALGPLPAIAALTLLGLAWWTIGSARWLLRLRAGLLMALPILLAGFGATYLAHRAGGWGVAAAVAIVCGIFALAFQPRVVFDAASPPRRRRAASDVEIIAPAREDAVSRTSRDRAPWLMSAVRFLLLNTAQLRRFNIVMFVAMSVFTLTRIVPGMAVFGWVLFAPKGAVNNAYSREQVDFIRARPFSGSQRFFGALVIPLLIALVVPVVMIASTDLDAINNGNLIGRLLDTMPSHDTTLAYLRDALGATFLPEKWPDGGLTQETWLRLRPLLWFDFLRAVAIIVAAMFSAALAGSGRFFTYLLFQLPALAAAIRLSMPGVIDRLPVPPLWFTALLAALAIANFAWRVRRENAPDAGAPTGSSTRG
ncbi:MAG TPA: hypothetical protein VN903_34365 [Polyangia bacterium]|jgi:hypothetical protein|nr:hypothetical protein [Polyangia bacterium]